METYRHMEVKENGEVDLHFEHRVVTTNRESLTRVINDYLNSTGQALGLLDIARTMLTFMGKDERGDVHVILRMREANLEAVTVRPENLGDHPEDRAFLTPVEPMIYRLGIPGWFGKPVDIGVIDVMREAGTADEVDEAFLGGHGRNPYPLGSELSEIWQLGFDESQVSDDGRTYDDDPGSGRSVAYDEGKTAGEEARSIVTEEIHPEPPEAA